MARLRHWMSRHVWISRFLLALALLVTLSIIWVGVWLFRLDRNVQARFAEKRFAPPIEFYSAPEVVRAGNRYPKSYFENLFYRRDFVQRTFTQSMTAGDYSIWTGDQCRGHLGEALNSLASPDPALDSSSGEAPAADLEATGDSNPFPSEPVPQQDSMQAAVDPVVRCIVFMNHSTHSLSDASTAVPRTEANADPRPQIIALTADGVVAGVFDRESRRPLPAAVIDPEIFAQYYGDKPVLRQIVKIGDSNWNTTCLDALIAVEDANFQFHEGVSITGLLRAFVTNLREGRKTQGGSTITQQLVKNYFLTDEKTLKRKIVEIAMAFIVERHATKDEILETYINLIYMGQNGPFEVRGFAAAADHYFGKRLGDLNLPECALLAGILNGPGVYNPFKHPDRALKRRTKVLERMVETNMIPADKAKIASSSALPSRPEHSLTEPAPYFVQAVRRKLIENDIDTSEGLRVYTTLNLRAQEAAHQAVRAGLERLETTQPQIKKLKQAGKSLEAVLISADPRTGYIEALVGGRGYLATQYNRAIDSHRQVGSVMKPFVYLAALEHVAGDGQPYNPLTLLNDKATTHRFEGQKWTPRNYDGTYHGDVPLYWSLKESLNAATVNLGMNVGLDAIIDVAQRTGVTSKISALPSLTLGAFELSPMEVLQSYGTISRMGAYVPLSLISRVEDLQGNELFSFTPTAKQVVDPDATAQLVGVMKQTVISGTGRGARLAGFTHPAAGKTGTTNDKKDAWFAGFTPHHTAIVWVGYDDNTSHNLTGGSGAVPIWTNYMKSYAASFPATDFAWPENTEKVTLLPEQLAAYGAPEKRNETPEPVELIFKRGQAPAIPDAQTGSPVSF